MRTITSPGVEINEKDLSLRVNPQGGTTVLATGFASQGPSSEPIMISTMSEFETIFGTPVTPAEKYFYYTCKEILNSQASLLAIRLPYGEDAGVSFGQNYSALLYPMETGLTHLNEPEISTADPTTEKWFIGKPKYVTLSVEEYSKIIAGDFEWTSTTFGSNLVGTEVITSGEADYINSGGTISIDAGFIVLNDLQTTVNEIGEGHYVGFADNASASMSIFPDFDSMLQMTSLSSTFDYSLVNPARLDFALSATEVESSKGVMSVSEQLEKVGFAGFDEASYQDYLSFGVFRIRRSITDASILSMGSGEKYLGSFNYNRKQITGAGGSLKTAFIEEAINESSPTIKMFVNPTIAKEHNWTVNSLLPTTRVFVEKEARGLFPLGIYVPDTLQTQDFKKIGLVPLKLSKSLRSVETPENVTIDIVVDAGLSTIHALTDSSVSEAFDDELYVPNPAPVAIMDKWKEVALELINFSQNTRRDCVTILDPLRSIFIAGKNSKVATEVEGKNFTQHIYGPLRELASFSESNYATMYANWVKTSDQFTSRNFWCPFSGYAAAIFARSDATESFWAAPAGLNRGKFRALDIALNPNQKQRDRLYEISVNPVAFFNGDGFVVMGQKTLQFKPTAFDRINVRRLFLYLERAVQRTIKYFVFEPNTSFTRSRVKNTLTPIFELARATEGVYDYLIVCDQRNNTPDVIDQNELVVDIYLKPVRTAEFILVNFIATRTGQNFQELIQG